MEEQEQVLGEYSEHITVAQLRKFYKKFKNYPDDTPISFETLMVAFFPKMFDNIMNYARQCYTNGYMQGFMEEKKDEN